MTQHATATAATEHGSKYLQQLCKHWSHKADTTFTPDAGSVAFDSGNRLTLTAHADHLAMTVKVPDDADLAHFRNVVDRHLLRFAFREDLEIVWT